MHVPACITSPTIKREIVRPKTNREKQYTKIQKHTHKIKIKINYTKVKTIQRRVVFKDPPPPPHPDTFKCYSLISVSFSFLPGGGGGAVYES